MFKQLIILAIFTFLLGCSQRDLWPKGDPMSQERPEVSRTIQALNKELQSLRTSVVTLNRQITNLKEKDRTIDVTDDEAFIIIKFGRVPPEYLTQLKAAVAQAVSTKADINFLIRAVATISPAVPSRHSADTRARQLAWQIKQDMLNFGINPQFIKTEALIDPVILQDEIRIFLR